MKTWICGYPLRAEQQILIKANTRAEAQQKLRRIYEGLEAEDYELLDIKYTRTGVGRVICEDKKRCPR